MLPGLIDSKESRSGFAALLLELEAAPHVVQTAHAGGILQGELLLHYLDHAERHYRGRDGKPTSEIYEVRVVIRALRELYPDRPVTEFGPLCLNAARQRWVADDCSRTECNQRVGIVKRIFKWAVSEELVPAATYQGLATVSALPKGRTVAPEKPPIGPVDNAVVDATLPILNRHVRGLIEFQRLTGCRPGEACAVRRCDIDVGGVIWVYRPPHHKNAHLGQARTISIGPKAQEVLLEFFTPSLIDYLFSPARAMEQIRDERSAKRKTPLYPSHVRRNAGKRKDRPRRMAAAGYGTQAYGHAVATACERAVPPPAPLGQRDDESHAAWWGRLTSDQRDEVRAWRKAHRWHPNQLRHAFATRVRKQHGLEAAQVLLGHARADVTQVYAERYEQLAATVVAKIG